MQVPHTNTATITHLVSMGSKSQEQLQHMVILQPLQQLPPQPVEKQRDTLGIAGRIFLGMSGTY